MAKNFHKFAQLPLELQRIILAHSDVSTRRLISQAFTDLKLYEQCRTPVTRKELDTYLSSVGRCREGRCRVGVVERVVERVPYPGGMSSRVFAGIVVPWNMGFGIVGRYYNYTLVQSFPASQFVLEIKTDSPVSRVPFHLPDKFKLDYKTSYHILKTRKNCRRLVNYPKIYILEQFEEYIRQINYRDLHSVALAYNFLSLNHDILYPDTPYTRKKEEIRFRRLQRTGKLVPVDTDRYRQLLTHYTEVVNNLIPKIRIALDELE